MSPPPLPNFQTPNATSTASSSSPINQGNISLPHFQYGSHPQMYHPQMYHSPMDHQVNPSAQQQQSRGGRRGRSRGGNNMSRRDFQIRQNNHHQQNEYSQPLMDQNQSGAVPYQQIYIQYPPWQNALPQNLNLTQNLTGQPLFAIQQPVLYQYGSPYPIMYNVLPQAHPMSHQQSEILDNEVQEPIAAWQQIAHTQQIFQHSPHAGQEIEFQVHPDEYQMMNQANEYQPEDIEINSGLQFTDYDENEQVLIEKTRDLMIQTTPPPDDGTIVANVVSQEILVSSERENAERANFIDNKMIVKNIEKPPAWSNATVPNLSAQQKKKMASVSVSAIPNKDVEISETNVNTALTEKKFGVKLAANSFSSITSSKQPITLPEGKKTENKQNEVQQKALIERAKQQIVTTITGVGLNQENDKKVDILPVEVNKHHVESPIVEKTAQVPKVQATASTSASWAGLFNSKPERSSKTSPQMHSQSFETQIKNSEHLAQELQENQLITSSAHHLRQVPSTTMSYSAVSAQISTPLANISSPQVTKDLPQNKVNSPCNNDENEKSNNNIDHGKTVPVNQHAIKLGGL